MIKLSSRRYIKRIWRVSKERGPAEYLATLIVKSLVKHGWPAQWRPAYADPLAFFIYCKDHGDDPPADFAAASAIAVRIAARTYNLDLADDCGFITFQKRYTITDGGHFKEVKP